MSEHQRRAPVHPPSEGTGFVSVEALDQTLAAAVDEEILGWTAKDVIGRLAEERG
ncbi:MAG TPA: hypothetical protein VKV41_07585 [Methylomirabilota bacterium]|nr:hypothetical protein [Methylomirabilota bacterium]